MFKISNPQDLQIVFVRHLFKNEIPAYGIHKILVFLKVIIKI